MKKSTGPRIGFALAALLLLLLGAATIKAASGSAEVSSLSAGIGMVRPLQRAAERSDMSPPLREIPLKAALPRQL